jgi:hypothetical protein
LNDRPYDEDSSGVLYLTLSLEWRQTWAHEGTSYGGKEGRGGLKGNMEVPNAFVIAESVPFGKEQALGEPCAEIAN